MRKLWGLGAMAVLTLAAAAPSAVSAEDYDAYLGAWQAEWLCGSDAPEGHFRFDVSVGDDGPVVIMSEPSAEVIEASVNGDKLQWSIKPGSRAPGVAYKADPPDNDGRMTGFFQKAPGDGFDCVWDAHRWFPPQG